MIDITTLHLPMLAPLARAIVFCFAVQLGLALIVIPTLYYWMNPRHRCATE
ncbi:MAG: hypothetical protein ACRES7_10260 [Gammaproteobacteria bacterium]